MSENLKSQLHKLEIVSQVKSLQARKVLLKEFSNDKRFCKAVREIVRNAIKKNIPLTKKDKDKLTKYRTLILQLAKKQKSKENSRKLVYQTGTGVLLPIVVPLVASIISKLVSRE